MRGVVVQVYTASPARHGDRQGGNWSSRRLRLSGSDSFTAKATDTAGNTTNTAQSRRRTAVDTTPPTETISTTINTNTGATGTITSGGATKDNTLGLSAR